MKRETKTKSVAEPKWAPKEPPTAAPALAALAKGVPIRLKRTHRGSMQIQKTARGLEFKVSRAQLALIAACLDIARCYNDEHLDYHTKGLRKDNMYPGDSRWHRDPTVAAANNRHWDMASERSRKDLETMEAELALHGKQAGLGVVV